MAIKLAINGFDIIGRLTLRQLFGQENIEIVAINDIKNDIETLAYLLQYDSVYKTWKAGDIKIDKEKNYIIIDGKPLKVFQEPDIKALPWKENNIDIVIETLACHANKRAAQEHISAGAKKVVISNIVKDDENIKTIVYDVNHKSLQADDTIIATASSAINALALICNALETKFGIGHSCITIIHGVTKTSAITQLRQERNEMVNIIPLVNNAADAISSIIPNFTAKLVSYGLCVPVVTGSLLDISLSLKTRTTVDIINNNMKTCCNESFGYNEDAIVSSDIIGSHFGAIFDATQTGVIPVEKTGLLIKLFVWYDNNMSYVSQLVRTILYFVKVSTNVGVNGAY